MTEHLAASWWFYSVAKGPTRRGRWPASPTMVPIRALPDLYWVDNLRAKEQYYDPHAPNAAKRIWFHRITDMIDRYHPDLLYSDSPLPYPDDFGRKLLAHYYNDRPAARRSRRGGLQLQTEFPGQVGPGLERGVMDKIARRPGRPIPAWAGGIRREPGPGDTVTSRPPR